MKNRARSSAAQAGLVFALAVGVALASPEGRQAAAPAASCSEEFGRLWDAVVLDLIRVREGASSPRIDADALAGLADRVGAGWTALEAKAKSADEVAFVTLLSSRRDEIQDRLARAVSSARAGKPDDARAAVEEIGFILGETDAFLKATRR